MVTTQTVSEGRRNGNFQQTTSQTSQALDYKLRQLL